MLNDQPPTPAGQLMAHPEPRAIYQYATRDFLALFNNQAHDGWDAEEQRQAMLSADRLHRITEELRTGPQWPIPVCFKTCRVMDGHHRVVAARRLRLPQILAVDAFTDTTWMRYLDNPQEP